MRSFSTILLGCFLASSLAACAGGHAGTTAVVPTAQQSDNAQAPHSKGRLTPSGCTPDSYGYCVVHLGGSHGAKVDCFEDDGLDHWYLATVTTKYELYYNNTDQGTYSFTTTNFGCPPESSMDWSPGDPAVVTGDPNLP